MSDQGSAVASKPAKKPFDISVLFAVCGVLFSILIFLFMSKQERETAIQQFHTEMAGHVADLQYLLIGQMQSMALLQVQLLPAPSATSLSVQAEAVLGRSPALLAIILKSTDAETQRWIATGKALRVDAITSSEAVIQQLTATEAAQSVIVASSDGNTLFYALDAVAGKRLIALLGINELVGQSALSELPAGVSFSILNAEDEAIYQHDIGVVAPDTVTRQAFKGGMPWSVTYAANDEYLASRTSYMPAMFLLMGLLLSFMVASYLKKQARNLTQLREQQEVLSQQVVDSTWNDPITGVANRTHFDETMDIECRRSVREFSPMTMMALEIDHFPEYIGCYGEQAAELALQQVANALAGCVTRPGDLLARIDNHQFGLVLPSTNEMATYLASRCCEAVNKLQIPHDASSVSEVMTISIGVVTLQPSKYLTPERLYEAACEQLLHAQNNGGNQYIAFAEHGLEPSVTYSV
jgi:diguanylate cyclase (GGDEF)-like protein